jgi:ribosomal protein S18 acetylase RimI-like enzyme
MSTELLAVRQASTTDLARVVEIMARGFESDPVFAYIYSDPETRLAYAQAFFRIFVPYFAEHGTIHLEGSGASAALWVAMEPDNEADFESLVGPVLDASGPYADRALACFEVLGAAHPHGPAHGYLNFVATLPASQGKGYGARVLRQELDRLDAAGTPAYLEATTERSAALYARLGFTHINSPINLPDGPRLYPMWREPQPASYPQQVGRRRPSADRRGRLRASCGGRPPGSITTR